MIYSVYNYGAKSYDYYDDGRPSSTHAGTPALSGTGSAEIGHTPEAAAWSLPGGARKVGTGDLPRGRIAASGFDAVGGGRTIALLLIGYLLWRGAR